MLVLVTFIQSETTERFCKKVNNFSTFMINFDLLDSQNYILNERTLYETIQKYLSVFINHHTYFFSEIRSHEEHQKRLSFQKLIYSASLGLCGWSLIKRLSNISKWSHNCHHIWIQTPYNPDQRHENIWHHLFPTEPCPPQISGNTHRHVL